jgi:hypothetical protein
MDLKAERCSQLNSVLVHFVLIYMTILFSVPRRRWVNNIKRDLREIEWDGMDWIDLAQDMDQWRAPVNTLVNIRDS